jgi:hypothetical protein
MKFTKPTGNNQPQASDSPESERAADTTFDPAQFDRPLLADGSTKSDPPDPFDPASLRLSQDFAGLGVKKALLTVPVRKPDKAWFVRVHPNESYRLQTAVIELKEDRESYLVAPSLWPDLAGESTFSPRALFTAMNRQGVLFLCPVRLPGADGKVDEWSRSAIEAAELATKGWVRVAANMALGAYEVFKAQGELADPDWPSESFRDLLHVAFKDRYIDTRNHAVLRKLRGEI